MLNLLTILLNNYPDYQPELDGFEREISTLDLGSLVVDTQIRMVPANDIEVKSIRKEGVDPFNDVLDEIKNEVMRLKEELTDYYNSDLDLNIKLMKDVKPSLKTINRELFKRIIRVRRLQCVLSPSYTETKSYNAKSDKYYSNAKCYYIDDMGEQKRMISKNVGTHGDGLEKFTARLMKLNGYDLITDSATQTRLKPDFIVEKGGVQYLVDVSLKNRDYFFKVLFTLELWSRYKDVYGMK